MSVSSTYTVEVHTTGRTFWKKTGTDDDVYLIIHGHMGKTDPHLLDKRFHDDLTPGSTESYTVKGPDVGDIHYVSLSQKGDDEWRLSMITVIEESGRTSKFPFFNWVPNDIIIHPGEAKLPQQETSEALKELRKEEINLRRVEYQYNSNNPGLPGAIAAAKHDDLPRFVQFHDPKESNFEHNTRNALLKFGVSRGLEAFDNWTKPEDLVDIARRPTCGEDLAMLDYLVKRWDEDAEFGRQVLNGVNPVMIQRCDKLPKNFPVTENMVKDFLLRKMTLEKEMKDGHVYYLNYEVLVGVPRFRQGKDVRFCADPLVLLYVRPSGELVPIAIKLDQADGPIWTPHDGRGWTLAKIYVKNADLQIHQMGTHLLKTHLASEAMFMALIRNIPSMHPVYKLLMPHTRHTVAINTQARSSLIQPGGVVDRTDSISGNGAHIDLARKIYRTIFKCDDLNVPKYTAKRGVDNKELLPNYHYRDDAMLLWDAIRNYAKEIVGLYYKSDNDVVEDKELQGFMKEMHDCGFPIEEGDVDKGVLESLKSIDQLCTVLTMIIFTTSCQHAAVNFGQFQNLAFPPNYPLALLQPPPSRKWEVSMEDIMAALPDKKFTLSAVAVVNVLSQYSPYEVFLGDCPEEYFTEADAKVAQQNFRHRLKEISSIIHKRNENLEAGYTYLIPERVPASVSI